MSNTIRILLTLDGKQYEANLQQAEKRTQGFARNVGNSLGGALGMSATQASALSGALNGIGAPLGIAAAAAAIAQLGINTVQTGMKFESLRLSLDSISDSSNHAEQKFQFIVGASNRLGIGLEDAASGYIKLAAATRGTVLEGEQTERIFTAVAAASAKLGLSGADTAGVLRALSQIASKGTLSAEELRQQMGDRIPGAFQLAADAMGVTTAELNQMLQRGEIMASDFLPRFAAQLDKSFGNDAGTKIDTTTASFTRLSNEFKLTGDAIASGVNPPLAAMAELLAIILDRGRAAASFVPAIAAINYVRERSQPAYLGGDPNVRSPFMPVSPYNGNLFDATPYQPFTPSEPQFYGQLNENLDEDQSKRLDQLREEYALLQLQTNEQKVLYQITMGRYRDEGTETKSLALSIAKLMDQREKEEELKRDAEKEGRRLDEIARRDAERSANADDLIQKAQDRIGLLNEEQRIGRQLTQSEQALFELRSGAYYEFDASQREQLRLTLEQSAATERLTVAENERERRRREGAEDMGREEQRIEFARQRGQISLFEAADQLDAVYQKRQMLLEADLALEANPLMRRDIQNELEDLERLRNPLDDLSRLLDDMNNRVIGGLRDSLTDMFAGIFDGTKSASEAFAAFGEAVSRVIARISAEIAATAVIQAILAPFGMTLVGGQLSNLPGSGGSIGGGGAPAGDGSPIFEAHTGGVIGADRLRTRPISMSVFAGAKRFHSGGMIGSNEVPIIAQRGEGVFTREQMKALGGGGGTVVQVINNTGAAVKQERGQTGDGRELVRLVIGAMEEDATRGGPGIRAISRALGASRPGRRA